MNDRARQIVIASVAGISQRSLATLGTLLIFPYVLRHVGLAGFALWGVAASLAMMINFADFGLGPMVINGLARNLAGGDPAAARRLIGAALFAAIVIAVLLSALAPVVYWLSGRGEAGQVYAIVALGVGINVPLGIANPMWIGMQKGWAIAFWEFVQTLLFVGGLYLCGQWSNDVRLFAAAIYLAIVLANLLNMVTLMTSHPAMRPAALLAPLDEIRSIVAPSARFFVLTILDALTYLLDAGIAFQVAGAVAGAQMAVIQRMAVAATGVMLILAQYQWPHHVEAWLRRDIHWMRRALAWSIGGVALLALGALGVLGLTGPALCRLWLGRDLGFHASSFGWLAAWIFVLGTARVLSTVLNAMNVLGFQIAAFAAFIVLSLGLKWALAREWGVDGILLGVVVPAAVLLIPMLGARLWWEMVRSVRAAS